jgi:protein-S-isoprenylcysteine O-methyltransferase Ste14
MPLNVPRFLIGIVVATYWARVMHMARKTRRRDGHAANVIPPTKWGHVTRAIWFPVVVLWILIPLASSLPLLSRYSGGASGRAWNFQNEILFTITPLFDSQSLQISALVVAGVAFVLTWICWHKMGTSWRMGIDPKEKTQLITTGPYSRIRHPIYALSSLLMLATAAAIPSLLMFLVAAMHITLLQLEADREEAHLKLIHGQVYHDYCLRSRRFLPRLCSKPIQISQ